MKTSTASLVPTRATKVSKRKRNVATKDLIVCHEQPMSRDASVEDNTDTSLQATTDASTDEPLRKRTKSDLAISSLPSDMELQYGFKINPPPQDRPVRIYCDGIYDLFHFGHARALEQAKKAFPNAYLLVGVCNDEETHKRKGRTVMTDKERYESVRHCKWVDEVVTDAPWLVDQEFLDRYKIDYVAHDAEPYQSKESGDVYSFVKDQGRFWPTQRTDGISTSDLITRVVRDYDAYLRRNIERGVSAKELNISFLKESRIKTKKSIEDLRKIIKTSVQDWMTQWEDKSHDFIRGFAGGLFGAEDVVDKFWKRVRDSSNVNSTNTSACSSRAPSEDESLADESEVPVHSD